MRILLAEDNHAIRENTAAYLRHFAREVVAVPDGQAAWEALGHSGDFTTILSDLNMPRMDGLELLARVRAKGDQYRWTEFILLTACNLEPGQQAILDAHRGQLMYKPFELRKLAAALGLDRRSER